MFCSKCGNEYQENDKFCSKCGKNLTEKASIKEEEKINQKEQHSSSQRKNSKGCIGCFSQFLGYLGIAMILFLLIIMLIFPDKKDTKTASKNSDNSQVASPEPSELNLKLLCRQAVRLNLKAPGSVKFPFGEEQIYKELEQKYTKRYAVESYVDAENSFGAKIRTNYKCVVNYDIKNEEISLYSFKFYE